MPKQASKDLSKYIDEFYKRIETIHDDSFCSEDCKDHYKSGCEVMKLGCIDCLEQSLDEIREAFNTLYSESNCLRDDDDPSRFMEDFEEMIIKIKQRQNNILMFENRKLQSMLVANKIKVPDFEYESGDDSASESCGSDSEAKKAKPEPKKAKEEPKPETKPEPKQEPKEAKAPKKKTAPVAPDAPKKAKKAKC